MTVHNKKRKYTIMKSLIEGSQVGCYLEAKLMIRLITSNCLDTGHMTN